VEQWHFRDCNYCNIFLKGFVVNPIFWGLSSNIHKFDEKLNNQ
jgi:hypothetical protein